MGLSSLEATLLSSVLGLVYLETFGLIKPKTTESVGKGGKKIIIAVLKSNL